MNPALHKLVDDFGDVYSEPSSEFYSSDAQYGRLVQALEQYCIGEGPADKASMAHLEGSSIDPRGGWRLNELLAICRPQHAGTFLLLARLQTDCTDPEADSSWLFVVDEGNGTSAGAWSQQPTGDPQWPWYDEVSHAIDISRGTESAFIIEAVGMCLDCLAASPHTQLFRRVATPFLSPGLASTTLCEDGRDLMTRA